MSKPSISDIIPENFNKVTENHIRTVIAKGQRTEIKLRPRILNEHQESGGTLQATIAAGANVVGQVFKASKDNITSLALTLGSAGGTSIDDFESYANSAALQVEWVKTGAVEAALETGIVMSGAKSMALPTDTAADTWVNTILAVDYTGYSFHLAHYQTKDYASQKIEFFIGDGVDTKSFPLVVTNKKVWTPFDIDETQMIEDIPGNTTNMAAITIIGFRIVLQNGGEFSYEDDLIATPSPGSIKLRLWDMGTTEPIDGVTVLNDGIKYTKLGPSNSFSITVPLRGGKRDYVLTEFTAGEKKGSSGNLLLNIGNYYVIEIIYVDTDVEVFGANPVDAVNRYINGYAFTTTGAGVPITKIGVYNDIRFLISSMQDIYVLEAGWKLDAASGANASMSVFLETKDEKIVSMITDNEEQPVQLASEGLEERPPFLSDGGKIEFYYNDDHTDSVSVVRTDVKFMYESPTVNG